MAALAQQAAQALKALPGLVDDQAEKARVSCDLDRCLAEMKVIIYGNGGGAEAAAQQAQQPDPAQVRELRAALLQPPGDSALLYMVTHHGHADFEARKLIAQVVSHMLRKYPPTVLHVAAHPEILSTLARGYQNPTIALTCGSMLRECLRDEDLHMVAAGGSQQVIMSLLVEAVQRPNFDIATDAFSSFKDLMILHKTRRCAEWMESQYEFIFDAFST